MSLREKLNNLLRGGVSTLVASVFSKIFVFIVNILVARHSVAADYGMFALIRSAIVSLETIISSSLSPLFIKKISEQTDKNINSAIFIFTLLLASIISAIIYCLIDNSIKYFNMALNGTWVLFFFSLLSSSLLNSILISNKLFREMIVSNVISFIISFSIYGMAFELNFSRGPELILAIFYSTDVFVKIFFLKFKEVIGNISIDTCVAGLRHFSNTSHAKLLFASLVNTVIFFKVRYDLGNDHSMSQLADFDVAYQYLMILILIQNSFASVLLSSYVISKNSAENSTKFYRLSSLILVFLSIFAGLLLAALAPFSSFIFGDQYNIEPIYGMALTVPLFSVALLLNRYMIAAGKEHIVAWAAIIPSFLLYLFSALFNPDAVNLSWAFSGYYFSSIVVYGVYIYMRNASHESTP